TPTSVGVEVAGEVFEAAIDGDGCDGFARAEFARELQSRDGVQSARCACENAFLFGQAASHGASLLLVNRAHLVILPFFQMRRTKPRSDAFDAVRSTFAGGQDGRRGWFEGNDLCCCTMRLQGARDAHQHAGGSDTGAEHVNTLSVWVFSIWRTISRTKLLEEFVADSHIALDGVVVVELIGVVRVWLIAELFCG